MYTSENNIKILRNVTNIDVNTVENIDVGGMFELRNGDGTLFLKLTNDGCKYIDCYNISNNITQKILKSKQCHKAESIEISYNVRKF